ncbi:ABC transporter ATP-binding protein [Pigmentiphaga kullae]|uniref:Amino acid/amide ABC transporter ATP-binding protein 1 (HAAT family) n=1 Tax=Pigmentiphaga kullae TaxID=151784 RepID=A0A4Q7NN71_9BURK|nr:ABC transporter ATP-binding protein [Pigmentiphaga kullae]RZS86593.1 amino acid/amide ABC transporter ATP-binding protein 1 (HAAT family) [Pigmentiphaga kullae]
MADPLLKAAHLHKRFQALLATDDVSLDVMPGEIHALIGPNGAGKSTLVNLLAGGLKPDSGTIELQGVRIDSMAPHHRVHAGLSRCFQVSSVFRNSTVRENLMTAVQAVSSMPLRPWGARHTRYLELTDRVVELAAQTGLEGSLDMIAGTLPHGAQRQLDVALALASRPKVLLLDEPMAGMGPDESERMGNLIDRLRGEMGILLIEHDMTAVFRLADRITVLVNGRVLASGKTDAIRNNAEVRAVYLGTEEEA